MSTSNVIFQMNDVTNLKSPSVRDYDVFIVALGDDERAYTVINKSSVIKCNTLVVISIEERAIKPPNFSMCGAKHVEVIPLSYNEFSSLPNQLNIILNDPNKTVAVDISCMTKPLFFYVLKYLQKRENKLCSVYYTEPGSYFSGGSFIDNYRSNIGPLNILEVPGYSGKDSVSPDRCLVILLGFDGDLATSILEDLSPQKTLLVNGFPGYVPKFKDFSLFANERIVKADDGVNVSYCRANNPFDVYNYLYELYNNAAKGWFMNVAPLGTKPMALGAAMFALHHQDVRVIYPMPNEYVKASSHNCWNSWEYVIPLIRE